MSLRYGMLLVAVTEEKYEKDDYSDDKQSILAEATAKTAAFSITISAVAATTVIIVSYTTATVVFKFAHFIFPLL